jgi:phosphotransferase system IIA component
MIETEIPHGKEDRQKSQGDEIIVFDMKQIEQKQRTMS